ncbi:transcriptional regulator, y4mF family [Mycobacteroides abscessus subsp. abscessus]|nr:transcriptional regulator, y4mF family [Mycobacteroides abscessus subsp. abscessus]
MQSTTHIGRTLRAHRHAAELTQEAAAVYAGISRKTLADLEKKQFPDAHLSTLLALMLTYGLTSLEALLGSSPSHLLAHAWRSHGWAGGTPKTGRTPPLSPPQP